MIRIAVAIIFLCGAMSANADTYKWTDDKGVVNFADDPGLIPLKYRAKAKRGEDITISSPKVQQELKEQEERARMEESSSPRIIPTPDYIPPPLPVAESPGPVADELPPGRPKSQRIKENIERRQAEEKARQVEEQKY